MGRHEAPYGGPLYDISPYLNLEQENRLAVCLESTEKYEKNYPAKGIFYGNVGHMVKGWTTHGWVCEDLKSMGIWRPVRLVATENIFMEAPFISTRKIEKNKAFLEGSVEVHNLTEQNVKTEIVGRIGGKNFNVLWERSSRVDITGKHNSIKVLSVKWQIPEGLRDSVFLLCATLKDKRGKAVSRSLFLSVCSSLLDDEKFTGKYRESPQKMPDFQNGPWVSELDRTQTRLVVTSSGKPKEREGNRKVFNLKVKNVGKVPSFQTDIEITSPDCEYYCSDNYFFLFPGEKKEIEVISNISKEKSLLIEVSAWNAAKIKKYY